MGNKKSRLVLELEPEVLESLQVVAQEEGVSVQDLCRSAIDEILTDHGISVDVSSKLQYDIEGLIALRKQIFGDRVLPTDSAEIIREAREERTRHMETL